MNVRTHSRTRFALARQLEPLVYGLAFASMVALPAIALAQYGGTDDEPRYASIGAILDQPVDDGPVDLQGRIVRHIDGEHYLFSDGVAEIRVEIDDDDLPAVAFDENSVVRLQGEVDFDDDEPTPEIEVDRITLSE